MEKQFYVKDVVSKFVLRAVLAIYLGVQVFKKYIFYIIENWSTLSKYLNQKILYGTSLHAYCAEQ